MPQENGNRTEVRWAHARRRLRLEGRPHFELTVRPWTTEALAAARHPPDLVPDRLALGQRRPRPPGPRLGLLRPRRPPAVPPRRASPHPAHRSPLRANLRRRRHAGSSLRKGPGPLGLGGERVGHAGAVVERHAVGVDRLAGRRRPRPSRSSSRCGRRCPGRRRRRRRRGPSGSCRRGPRSASQARLTSLSRPEKPPRPAMSASEAMIAAAAVDWLETASVPPPLALMYASAVVSDAELPPKRATAARPAEPAASRPPAPPWRPGARRPGRCRRRARCRRRGAEPPAVPPAAGRRGSRRRGRRRYRRRRPGRRRSRRPRSPGRRPGRCRWWRGRASGPTRPPGRSGASRSRSRSPTLRVRASGAEGERARGDARRPRRAPAASHSSEPGLSSSTISSVITPRADRERAGDAGERVAPREAHRAGADQRGGERRELAHVVRVEDALGAQKATAAVSAEPPTARTQPVTGSRRAQARRDDQRDARDEREAEQPAGLPAERLVEQPQRARVAAEQAAAATAAHRRRRPARRPGRRAGRGRCSPMISDQMLLSDVPEIHGRDDAGVSATSSGHAPPATTIASPPPSSPRDAVARRGPQPRHRQRRHDQQRRAHLGLEPEPDARAREHQPAHAPVLERPHDAPTARRRRTGRAARPGCCGARPRPRSASAPAPRRPTNPPARPKRRRDEVVDEPDRRDAHQRLRHEHRPAS